MTTSELRAKVAPQARPEGARSEQKRLDIQGLRMVAVIAVVVNHLTGHPRGAFVGVDVFFVISGYLITSLLFRSLVKEPRLVGFVSGFYRRRVRRLFPAALAVALATVVVARLLLNHARFVEALHSALLSTVFMVNWHLASSGTDYFAAGAPPSPFQHYWSLSVEEQFYLVWPLMLFGAGAIAVRIGRSRRAVIGVAALVICVVSLALAAVQSSSDPSYAYFSSFTRAWELGLGALLACLGGLRAVSTRTLSAMSWAGVTLIFASFFAIRGGVGFPFPGALLPCAGAVLVLSATSDGHHGRNFLLTNRVSVFVGDISYSVYLVHFPVIVLLSAIMLDPTWYFYVIATALTIGLSVALYGFVEQPVLRSSWLMSGVRGRRRDLLAGAAGHSREYGLIALASVVLSLVLLVSWDNHQAASQAATEGRVAQALHGDQSLSGASGNRDSEAAVVASPIAVALHRQIVQAVQATRWPDLRPSMDAVLSAPAFTADVNKCGNPTLVADECVFGSPDAAHTIELVGDSQSIAWVGAFRSFVATHPAWNVRVAGGFACEFADTLIVTDAGEFSSHCTARNQRVVADIKQTRPDVLVLSNRWTRPSDLASAGRELDEVRASVHKVVLLGPPPPVADPHSCYRPGGSPVDCLSKLAPETAQVLDNERALMGGLGGTFIDTTDWFCASGYCPAFAGSVPTYFDSGHISQEYSAGLGPVLAEALRLNKLT